MAVDKSVFDSNSLSMFVKKEYGVIISFCEKLERGSANVYRIRSSDNQIFILKELQSSVTYSRILKEFIIYKHLSQAGLKTPSYIVNNDGQLFSKEKGHFIVLQSYIEGKNLNAFDGTWAQAKQSAVVYAQIINALQTLPIQLPRYNLLYSESDVTLAIEEHKKKLLTASQATQQIIRKKIEWLNELAYNGLPDLSNITLANSHGDYSVFQLLFDQNDNLISVLDFLSAKQMPITLELVRSFFYIYNGNTYSLIDADKLLCYLRIFNRRSNVKLTEADIDFLFYPYYLRLLFSVFCIEAKDNVQASIAKHLFLQCQYLHNHINIRLDKLAILT